MWYNFGMKKIAILYTKYSPVIDAIKYKLQDYQVDCIKSLNEENYDLVILSGYEGVYEENALVCHHSLLPSFDCDEPEKQAILTGVKITGVTIYYSKTKKIVAQYPVFINNDMHYDNLKQELDYVEQTIFPLVIEKIVENKPFEINSLINNKCGGLCGGCSSCKH